MFTAPILITVLDTVEVTPFFQFFFVKHPLPVYNVNYPLALYNVNHLWPVYNVNHPLCKRMGMVQKLSAWVYIYNLSLHWCCKRSWSWHQNCKRCPSTSVYELLSLNFNSLFSSLLLGWSVWDVYIYIDVYSGFCVLLVVLCFYIMYLLSQVRSLGRCF